MTSPDAKLLGSAATGSTKALATQVTASRTTATRAGRDGLLGEDALTAVAPVTVTADQTWSLLVSAPRSAALAASHSLRTTTLLLGLLAVLVAGAVTWVIGTGIGRPIRRLRDSLADIADGDGDLTKRVDDTRRDELGELGGAFNRFAETIAGTVREVSAQAGELHAAAARLDETSHRLGEDVHDAAQRSGVVAEQADAASGEVTGIAAAAEEMGSSISEIARGTSEAARAGDAGKGFAVVAGEVKELSLQTARATEDIERKIVALQGNVAQASSSVALIGTVVDRPDEIQATVAAAVEEQSAVTGDLAMGVARAASATHTIAGTIGEVAQVAERTTASAAETDACARQVAGTSEQMRELVGRFEV